MVEFANARKLFEIAVAMEGSDIDLGVADRLVALYESCCHAAAQGISSRKLRDLHIVSLFEKESKERAAQVSGNNLLITKGGE